MENEAIALWDAVAQDWARFAETNDYRNFFLIPETFKLLGEVAGKRVLDLGCGEGGYARRLAKLGAEVTAVDASREMIGIAEERAQREGLAIMHRVRDAAALDGLEDGSFEIVVAAMSLMLDVERYQKAGAEVWRVLKPGGRLLMSILHPCFTSRGSHWELENGEPRHLVIQNYYDTTPWLQFIRRSEFSTRTLSYHRPLQDYLNPLARLSFRLMKFHEPIPTPEQMQQSQRFSELARVPLFLFLEWQK